MMRKIAVILATLLFAGALYQNAPPAAAETDEHEVRVLLSIGSDTALTVALSGSFSCAGAVFSDGTLTAGVTKQGVAVRHSGAGLVGEGDCVRIEAAGPNAALTLENARYGRRAYTGQLELSVTPKGYVRAVNCVPLHAYQAATLNAELPLEAQKAFAVAAGSRARALRDSEARYDLTDADALLPFRGDAGDAARLKAVSAVSDERLILDGQALNCRLTECNGGQTLTPKLIRDDDPQSAAYALQHDPFDAAAAGAQAIRISAGEAELPEPLARYLWKLIRQTDPSLRGRLSLLSLSGYYSEAMLSGVTLASPAERAPQEAARATLRITGPEGEERLVTATFPLYELVTAGVIRGGPYDTYLIHAASEAGPWLIQFANAKGDRVGLSLAGAAEMGRQGKTYREILAFYYPGATLTNECETPPGAAQAPDAETPEDDAAAPETLSDAAEARRSPAGDVNGDGRVDEDDLRLMTRFVLGLETLSQTRFDAADMDGNGRVNIKDLRALRALLRG